MLRFIFAGMLAVLATCGHAADSIVYYGPSGTVLAAGKYQRVTVSWKNGKPVMETVTVMEVGGNVVTPPPIDPPPVDPPPVDLPPPVYNVTEKIESLIGLVTTDTDKPKTSKGIADGYQVVIQLVNAGTLRTPDIVRMAAKLGIDTGLQQVGKTSAWKPFTDGMEALTKAMDLPALVNAYTIAAAKLGGTPTDPPPPIDPPPPATKVTAVVYVYEKDSNAVPLQVAKALQDINAAGLAVASDFEEDTVNGLGQTPEQYKTALAEARKNGLPCLVVLSGQSVHKVVKDPKTTAQVMEAMQ